MDFSSRIVLRWGAAGNDVMFGGIAKPPRFIVVSMTLQQSFQSAKFCRNKISVLA